MLANAVRRMTLSSTLRRTKAVAQQMVHSTASPVAEAPVLSESNLGARTYILNRPRKLNALNEPMLNLLRPLIEEWTMSELCRVIIGTGVGRAFCAGGDVESVVIDAVDEATRHKAVDFFKREFELDYLLAILPKPYVAVCDGITMGGGFGLAAHAYFRIASERTQIAMPETKIGYCPDVGANHFLSRLDGEIGTYMALTAKVISGRAAFEHGLATHFVPSSRIPHLLSSLSSLEHSDNDGMSKVLERINNTIEAHYSERSPDEPNDSFTGAKRDALDSAFGHNTVEEIMSSLKTMSNQAEGEIGAWAKAALSDMELRSPTSLRVALEAIRRGKQMDLLQVLQMELGIATAFCSGASPDFHTGVTSVVVKKEKTMPEWSPRSLSEITHRHIISSFFDPQSPFVSLAPKLASEFNGVEPLKKNHMRFALPSEDEIEKAVRGDHISSAGHAITLEELLDRFDGLRGNKQGVREKVSEVASRRCEVENSNHQRVLRWKW